MKYKTSDLEGTKLDEGVARALGYTLEHKWGVIRVWDTPDPLSLNHGAEFVGFITDEPGHYPAFRPSAWWPEGGELIEEYGINLSCVRSGAPGFWCATLVNLSSEEAAEGFSERPLVAAMRALVAAKFGAEVELS